MKKLCEHWKQIVASLLIVTMFATSVSLETFATEATSTQQTETSTTSDDVVKKEDSEEYQINKSDIIQSELTTDSTTYNIGNGKKVTEFYSQDVRFEDEDGELVDYDPTLMKVRNKKSKNGTSLENYVYENKSGDKKQYFPEELTEETPILMEYGDYQIRLVPTQVREEAALETAQMEESLSESMESDIQTADESTVEVNSGAETIAVAPIEIEPVTVEEETVTDIYEKEKTVPLKAVYPTADENVSFQYTSTDIGVKEEIILEEIPDTNIFTSIIEIPGLTIRENATDEGLTIYDGDEIVAGIMAPNMNDATGEAYSEEAAYDLVAIDEEAGKYQLILTVDEEYLQDEERQYPVTIDPTITWSGNSQVCDVYVLSGSTYKSINFYDSGITAFHAGKVTQGISRTYIAFASVSALYGRYVESAKLVLTEATSSDANQTVNAYRVTGSWTKSKITWNNKPAYNTTVLSSIKTKGTSKTKYTLNLTTLFRGYAKKSYSNYGILLKNPTETGKHGRFFGARVSTASYRPKLTIVHYDPPTTPTSVTPSPRYLKQGSKVKVTWAGISSQSLSYVQYRLAGYDHAAKAETGNVVSYSTSTKIGTAGSGSATIDASANWSEGEYTLVVRGVDSSGVAGTGKGTSLYIDGTPPTGTITIKKAGSDTETDILQDTVQIIGNVDGTISPIAMSSMSLYDENGNFIKDIYTNSTLSKIQNEFTPELPNGKYVLKLSMTDKAGNTGSVEKEVEVANKLAAPSLKTVKSNSNVVQIPWEFEYASGAVCGLAYKLSGSEEWTKVETEDPTKTSGTLEVTLPEEEGIYDVTVCGIDAAGSHGAEATVECIIDKTAPTAEITKFDRGLLQGTVADTYLKEWKVYLKKEGEALAEEDEAILKGTSAITNADMGVIDFGELEADETYVLTLKATDKAGNETADTATIIRQEGDTLVEKSMDGFYVKRPLHEGNTSSHIIFPQNLTRMELATYPIVGSIPEGDVYWYCENEKVSTEDTWKLDLSKEEGLTRSILAIIKDADGTYYYSRNRVKNRELLSVTTGTAIEFPEGCVSFRLNTGRAETAVQASVDGKEITLNAGQTYHVAELTAYEEATAESITITTDQSTENWILETDCITPETFEFTEMANYHPYEVSAADKLNYKTYLKWKGVEGDWPVDISYEIYRGLEEDFTPSEKNLIATDVKANYWVEMNVNYSKNFYYRIRAVKKDTDGNVVKADSYSYVVESQVVAADEYVKRMGVKEYWEYAEFETPSGDGYIEKSRGNLVYIQADATIPNEQLPVTLERTYNSQSTAKTVFGVGWTHSFDMELLSNCVDNTLDFKNVVFKDGNGTLYHFEWNEDAKSYTSSMGKYVNLVKEDKTETVNLPEKTIGVSDQKKEVTVTSAFTMTTKDNVVYRFNSGGQLVYMAEANGNFLLFEYEPNKGLLSKVTTSKNLTIEFVYHTDADYTGEGERPDLLTVKEILLPDGSKMSYQYENSRLTGVIQVGTDQTSTISWAMEYEDDVMTSITDAKKNAYIISYAEEKAEKVTYPNGEAIKLVYDTENNQTETYKVVNEEDKTTDILLETNTFEASSGNSLNMTDSYGNSVDYEYQDNLLVKMSYSNTHQKIEDGVIKEVNYQKEEAEKSETNTYDSRENLTAETDEDGITTTYEYKNTVENLKNLPTRRTEVDRENVTISDETYEYDKDGNVTKTYDAIGDITTITTYHTEDSTGDKTLKGEVASETEYVGDENHNKTTTEYNYSYDDQGNKTEICKETSGDYTVTTTTVYDVMGREISSTDTHGTTTATEYDAFGRIAKIEVTQGTGDNAITDIVTRAYDDNGTLVKEVESDGTVYTYSYDNMNRVIAESIQSGDLNKTWTTSYSYGSVEINNGKGKETVEHVLITEEKNPDEHLIAVTYVDALGKTVREKENGLYTDYVYDREGKVTFRCALGSNPEKTDPIITAYLYDEYGNNSHQILNPIYDAETDTFQVTDASLTQSMTYDSTGNVLSATDGEGNVTSYTYDENGRVTQAIQTTDSTGEARTTTVQYDVKNADGTTSDIITDALGRTSVTTYNSTMQPISISDQGKADETTGESAAAIEAFYTYSSKGLLTKETTSLGTAQTYEYDSKDRVTTIHYLNKDGAEELRTYYTYDKSDNITTMKDYKVSDGTATLYRYTGFTYDRLKRMTELVEVNTSTEPTEDELKTHTTKYTYDIDGNLTKVVYPEKKEWNVKELEYVYNTDKWLTEIKVSLVDGTTATLRTYSYNAYGDVSEIKDYRVLSEDGTIVEDPEYTTCAYAYDSHLRPVSMEYTDSADPETVKESYTYEYDKNSQIIKETLFNNYPTETEDKQNEERTYSYDTDGKLLSMTVNDLLNEAESYTVSYTYDRVGNRLSQEKELASGTETTEYTYNSLNQLLSSVTTDEEGTSIEEKSYLYDANGSQIKETDSISNTVIESSYDSAGRLATYKKTENSAVTVTQTNQYNGAGARIQKTEGDDVTNYYYSQGSVLYTEDGAGTGTSLNLSGVSGNIIATARADGDAESYYYYHKDAAGSTTNLRDASGAAIVSYQYTDFGETSAFGNKDFYNEICYNGAIYDKSTGLYYLSVRYYDPSEGRFISRDSYRGNLSNPSTLQLYAYCANNPVNYDDPSGHIAISRIIGGIVGGGVGAYIGSKIAKKTKAKGWKKVAIIAGCTVAGAVVGALAGPKVAKVAKKAVKVAKKKLKSVAKTLKKTKKTAKKLNISDAKKISKTKTTIKKATKKSASNTIIKGTRKKAAEVVSDGITEGSIDKLSGESFGKGFRNGVIRSVTSGMVSGWKGDAIAGATVSFIKEMEDTGDIGISTIKAGIHAVAQGVLSAFNGKFVKGELESLTSANSFADKVATKTISWMENVYGIGVDESIDWAVNKIIQ